MITEGKKYRAYTLNVSGFALMSPLGRIVLEPVSTFNEFGAFGLICYLLLALGLTYIGISVVVRGCDILES